MAFVPFIPNKSMFGEKGFIHFTNLNLLDMLLNPIVGIRRLAFVPFYS